MIQAGKLNATNFWKIKSQVEKNSETEPYDTTREDDYLLKEEYETKEYITQYLKIYTKLDQENRCMNKPQQK